jgi:hypothetical protein
MRHTYELNTNGMTVKLCLVRPIKESLVCSQLDGDCSSSFIPKEVVGSSYVSSASFSTMWHYNPEYLHWIGFISDMP